MNVYIYEGDLYCEDCARYLEGEAGGPYPNGGGEADTPQHCYSCGVFLQNPLTDDGRRYVCEAVLDYLRHKQGIYSIVKTWAVWYDIDVSELMELVGTTFAEVQDGEVFVRNGMVYMKVPEISTSIGRCDVCGFGINAVTIGRQDGGPLTDSSGRPVLPWCVHFCPSTEIERLSLSAWEVNARRWHEKLCNTIGDHNAR